MLTNSNLARLTAIHTNVRGIYGRSDTAAGVWRQSLSRNGVWARHPEMMKRMKAEREQQRLESGQKPQQ